MFRKLLFIKCFELALILSISLLFLNCEKESLTINSYTKVSDELCPYFQRFEEEGAKREIAIDLEVEGIKAILTKLQDGHVGLCNRVGDREIIIDQDFWKKSSDLKKELIVFHELGHCYLGKSHNNQSSVDGVCLSIMRSGAKGCIDFYTDKTRNQLLNELFTK